MKVVFLEDVEGVAQGGEVKDVKNGFARNYLLPKNLAAPATHNNLQKIEKLRGQANVNRVEKLEDMKSVAEGISGTEIFMEMRAGANDRLYGSVTGTMIADSVSDKTGVNVERRWVQLDNPIRETGEFDVFIRLHSDVSVSVKVIVHATGQDPLEDQDDSNDIEPDQDGSDDEVSTAPSNNLEEASVAEDADIVLDSKESESSENSESLETEEESAEVDSEEN